MNILYIYAHPNPSSFNGLLKQHALDLFAERKISTKLSDLTASLVVTTQSPESAYQTDGLHQATIDSFLHHIHHTLRFVGIKTITPFIIYAAFNLDATRQEKIINDYRDYLDYHFFKCDLNIK